MAIQDLPKYKDIRGSIRRSGRYPYVGTSVKDTHVIHHSLTLQHLGGANPQGFARTHIDTNGWHGCAYPFVIMPDGTIYQTDDIDRRTYHAGNTNTRSIGTCVVGDFRKGKEKPTQAQLDSLFLLNAELFKVLPNMKYVKGHQECEGYAWKNCPGDNWNYRDAITGKTVTKSAPIEPEDLPESYVVQEGDTFYSIGKELEGITMEELLELNPSVKPTELRIGMTLTLVKTPTGANYTVKDGDTLWGISRANKGITVADIKQANKLKSDNLSIGQVLVIPKAEVKPIEAPKPVVTPPAPKPKPKPVPKPAPKPVPVDKFPLDDKVLRYGDKGSSVTKMQKALCAVNFYPDKDAKNFGVDGSFGPDTLDALKRFQSIYARPADGVFGPATRKKLDSLT